MPRLDELEWEDLGELRLDSGGEGIRAWSDNVNFSQAEVPGGVLVMAVRDSTRSGPALVFVPFTEKDDG